MGHEHKIPHSFRICLLADPQSGMSTGFTDPMHDLQSCTLLDFLHHRAVQWLAVMTREIADLLKACQENHNSAVMAALQAMAET